ncbi:MAG: UDP-GlcNAc:undecaprenyl-phosphate GlcNAc-1-phosphate transferase [Halieaceae bacterium]|jgi:UDP-GlcNAc:undecaprenyl-phosphate GlcNAc-1-phosphate transferase
MSFLWLAVSELLQQALVAFVLTLLAIVLLARLAPQHNLMDKPDGRKLHAGDVPLVGGIAIYLSLCLGALIWGSPESTILASGDSSLGIFLLGGGILVLLGAMDDRSHVSVFTRVVVEVGVALLVIEGLDLKAANLGDLVGTGNIKLAGWLAYPFTVMCIFGVINAFNMLDGLDGALGVMVLITLLAFHLFAAIEPEFISVFICFSLVAFLVSNLGLAPMVPKSFLGDAGSKLLGFIVVALILSAASAQIGGGKYLAPVTALYLIGLPLFDMVFTTLRRAFRRRPVLGSDRTHIHHLMQALGMSDRRALTIIAAVGLASPFLGLMLSKSGASTPHQFFIFLGCFGLYCVLMSKAWRVSERLQAQSPGARQQPVQLVTSYTTDANINGSGKNKNE